MTRHPLLTLSIGKIVGFCMMCTLERQVTRALATAGGVISPSEVVQNLRRMVIEDDITICVCDAKLSFCPGIAPGFRPGRQEDAHEFLRFVIESAQKSCLYLLQKDKYV